MTLKRTSVALRLGDMPRCNAVSGTGTQPGYTDLDRPTANAFCYPRGEAQRFPDLSIVYLEMVVLHSVWGTCLGAMQRQALGHSLDTQIWTSPLQMHYVVPEVKHNDFQTYL
jgi:hypothetical protein